MQNFEKFGNEFQVKLLHHLVADESFSLQLLEILDPAFFSKDGFILIASEILKWNSKYNTIPTFENLRTIISLDFEEDEIQRTFLLSLVEEIEKQYVISDKEFIEERTLEFCKQQSMKNAILSSVELLKQEKYEDIYNLIQKALSAGDSRNVGHDYVRQCEARTLDRRNPISTGFELIDRNTAGGLSAGEIGLIMAATNIGKSMVLAHIAATAFSAGKNVAVYSLEMGEKLYGVRIDSKLSGINLTKLISDSTGVYRSRVKETIEKIQNKYEHKPEIHIKEYPTKQASVRTIKNDLLTLRRKNFIPDLVIVDYADLLKPETKYNDKRFELESNVEQLRGLGGLLSVPVWSATQAGREALDMSIVTLKLISEALSKAMVADLVVSIGITKELLKLKRACYYLAKNRNGDRGLVFEGQFDTSNLTFTIDREGLSEEEVTKADRQNILESVARKVLSNGMNGIDVNRNLGGLLD